MKKFIIAITIIIVSMFSASAQENTSFRVLPCGSNVVDASIGLGSYSDIVIPPLSVSYERILLDYESRLSLGVGGYAGMLAQKSYSGTTFGGSIAISALAHMTLTEKAELYAGPFIGYIKVSSGPVSVGTTAYGAMLGARYFFTEQLGANFHLGGLGVVNFGISFRL